MIVLDFDDREALKTLLQNFTYKPGWTFTVEPEGLLVQATVVDTDDHKKLISITFSVGIPSYVRDEFPWERWLLDQIMMIENHEAREFFKINGVKVFDPHG